MLHLPNECTNNTVSIFPRDLDKQDKPGLTLDQGSDVAVLAASQKIALPMARYRSVLYLGRALSDGYGVNDLTPWLSAGGGALASAHQPPCSQPRDQLLLQDPASLDEQA